MKANIVYLQAEFWKQLQTDTSIDGLQSMMNVFKAISEANLRTDIDDYDWDNDPCLRILWKRYLSHQSDIELYEKISVDKPEDNAEDLSAIYFTHTDNATCNDLGTQYGIVAINKDELIKKEYLFGGDGFILKKNNTRYSERYMQFYDKIHYPCNSMIVIDPYILSKTEDIEKHLYSLLDATLPNKKLQVEFHISIYSMIGDKNIEAISGEKVYNRISNLIAALRKGLKFKLTLYAISHSEEFHSRMIITNNVLFNAADGFDVFREDDSSNKNAKFDIILPRLVGNSRLDMTNYIRWIRIAKNRSKKQSETQFWGSRENRLFELVS